VARGTISLRTFFTFFTYFSKSKKQYFLRLFFSCCTRFLEHRLLHFTRNRLHTYHRHTNFVSKQNAVSVLRRRRVPSDQQSCILHSQRSHVLRRRTRSYTSTFSCQSSFIINTAGTLQFSPDTRHICQK